MWRYLRMVIRWACDADQLEGRVMAAEPTTPWLRPGAALPHPDLTERRTCARCGVTAAAAWRSPDEIRRLDFCGHHSHQHGQALKAKGWALLEEALNHG